MKLSWKGRTTIALGIVCFLLLIWIFYEKRAMARDQELGLRLSRCIVSEINFPGVNGIEALGMFHEKLVEIDPWFENVNIRYELDESILEDQTVLARWGQITALELLREMLGNDLVEDVLSGVLYSYRNGEIIIFEIEGDYKAPMGARLYNQLFLGLYEIDHSLSRMLFGDDSNPDDPFGGSSNRLGLTDWM